MDDNILSLMLFGSLVLGSLGVIGFVWGLRSGQFDDEKKFTHGLLFDDVEELRDAAKKDAKKEESKSESSEQAHQ
ncbi:MAG: cbb3-type cytochrome oxidase assembly protein CcoS [Campylobacterales bacterium]|nr:cbb3-type cytochrome oxidase assembly protein CcoS [Campylobacterales bacterium]